MRTLREAVGPDVDIMLDCWMSWDVPYTIEMARRLAPYEPRCGRPRAARQDPPVRRDPPRRHDPDRRWRARVHPLGT